MWVITWIAVHEIKPEIIVSARNGLQFGDLQRRVKQASGKWNRERQLWKVRYDRVVELGLEDRIKSETDKLKLSVGDATAIEANNESFDAIFDFGILHHVPDWRAAIAEIRRVLRPGGRFYFMEVTRQALDRRSYRHLFVHPTENRFGREEFVAELERQGITVRESVEERFFGDFIYGVGRCAARASIRSAMAR